MREIIFDVEEDTVDGRFSFRHGRRWPAERLCLPQVRNQSFKEVKLRPCWAKPCIRLSPLSRLHTSR